MVVGFYLSLITINISEVNAPTKRQRQAEWIQKQNLYVLTIRDTQTEREGLEKDTLQAETRRNQEKHY